MQHFDYAGFTGTTLNIQRTFADNDGGLALHEISPEFTGDFGEHLAVTLILSFVVDVACFLYPDGMLVFVIPEEGKPRTAERKVAGDDVGIDKFRIYLVFILVHPNPSCPHHTQTSGGRLHGQGGRPVYRRREMRRYAELRGSDAQPY